MNFSKVISEASKKNENTTKMPVLVTKLPPPKKIIKERKGVQSAAVRAFLEKKEAEDRQKAEEDKKKKMGLLKARADANHKRKAHAMASRTKDNLQVFTPEENGEDQVKDEDVKVKPEDLSKKLDRKAHQVSEDWFKKRQEILERMKKPKEPEAVAEKNGVANSSAAAKSRERVKESSDKHHKDRHKNTAAESDARKSSEGHSSKHKSRHKHKHKRSSKDRERESAKESPWISVKKKPAEVPPPAEPKKLPMKKPKQNVPPPMSYLDILKLAQQQKTAPAGGVGGSNPPKKPEKETRPMTQEEKERAERKNSKEYQNWLKFGGQLPGRPSASNTNKPGTSALKNRDMRQENPTKSKQGETTEKPRAGLENKSGVHKTVQGSKRPTSNISASVNSKNIKDSHGTKASSMQASSQKHVVDKERSSLKRTSLSGTSKQVGAVSKERPISEEDSPKAKKLKGREEPQLSTWDRLYGQMHGKKQHMPKRPMVIESDEDEYEDDDMDDFIDDGDAQEDYSSAIKEIFGYDKRKYRYIDEEDESDMEAGFADVEKEEAISAKIGYLEDLEDIKKEEEEKKRKLMKMKMKNKLKS